MVDSGQSWFYILTIAFAFGIFIRSFWALDIFWVLGLVLVGVMVWWAGRGGASSRLFITSLILLGVAVGIFRMEWASWSETNPYLESKIDEKIKLAGIVVREPEVRARTTHLYLKTEHGLILVYAPAGGVWRYGDYLQVEGALRKPEIFETDLGRSFNYRGFLLAQGVSYTMNFVRVETIDTNYGWSIFSHIFSIKHTFMRNIERLIPEPAVGLGEGLLLGVKRALGDELEKNFRRTGIIHIVVLSGYNVMIVVTFILYVLGAFFGRRFSTLFGLIGIVLFAILVGLGPTVVRASLMASLLLIMGLTGRIYFALKGLLLAAVLMLLWNPYALVYDVGFQLSFLATLGLILFSPHFEKGLSFIPTFMGMREFTVATLATTLFVLPILLWQIGEFSLVAVIVNVLVLPAVATSMLLTFLTGILAFISISVFLPIVNGLAYISYLSLMYIIVVAEWFGSLPFAAYNVPAFSFYLVPFSYLCIGYLVWRLKHKPDELRGWTIVDVAS